MAVNVTHIVATHGHGDHWFTAGVLADRFDAPVVASPGTIEQMHNNVVGREAVWDPGYPGHIPPSPVTATIFRHLPSPRPLLPTTASPSRVMTSSSSKSGTATPTTAPSLCTRPRPRRRR
jgi:hypothetical protein